MYGKQDQEAWQAITNKTKAKGKGRDWDRQVPTRGETSRLHSTRLSKLSCNLHRNREPYSCGEDSPKLLHPLPVINCSKLWSTEIYVDFGSACRLSSNATAVKTLLRESTSPSRVPASSPSSSGLDSAYYLRCTLAGSQPWVKYMDLCHQTWETQTKF